MNKSSKIIATAVLCLTLSGAGASVALAGSDGDTDANETETPIAAIDIDQASAAALAHTGEGQVSDTEVGDEESYYEVEVTLDDGSEIDVQLDEQFNVVGDEAEVPGED